MRIATSGSTDHDARRAARQVAAELDERLGAPPDLLMVHGTVETDPEVVLEELGSLYPGTPIFGGTSCLGVITEQGFHGDAGHGLGILGVSDPEGCYGVGHAVLGDTPRRAGAEAVLRALESCRRPGEVPRLLLVECAPGREELVLEGIAEVVGHEVPILGGSSADNTIEGHWRQFTPNGPEHDAVVIACLFPSVPIGFSFHSGYTPTDCEGLVTRASGRTIYEIDGRPAAEVYNAWSSGSISDLLDRGGSVLAATTMQPLGRPVTAVGGVPFHCLAHPASVTPDGAMSLFVDVEQGERVVLMSGTENSLVSRASRVAEAAVGAGGLRPEDVAGALVVYCAGCMLAVRDRVTEVVGGLRQALKGAPFLGAFTFGEQGNLLGARNMHGNLMISVAVFSTRPGASAEIHE